MLPLLKLGIGLLLALTTIVFVVRLHSLAPVGSLFTTTGTEEAPIYSVWKVANAYPLYESPLSGNYGLGLYNWLFYMSYGSIIKLLGLNGSDLIQFGRMLTLAFAALGCVGFNLLLRRLTPRLSPIWTWIISLLVWADSGEAGWWQISVRPDFAALAAATWAFWFLLGAIESRKIRLALAASCLFYTAWSFKQTTILFFAGSCLALLLEPRWIRGLVALLLPFSALVALTFRLGGHNYFLNTVYAPSINPFVLKSGVTEIARAIFASPFLWLGGLVGAIALLTGSVTRNKNGTKYIRHAGILLSVYCLACVGDCVGICRLGSSRNTLFEAFLISALLVALLLEYLLEKSRLVLSESPWEALLLIVIVANLAVLGGRLVPSAHLGRLALASDEEFAEKQKLVLQIRALPAPVFVREGILSLPWIANRNHYPVAMDDVLFYQAAVRHGDFTQYPIKTLIDSHRFASLLVNGQDPAIQWALDAGCVSTTLRDFSEWSLVYIDCHSQRAKGPVALQ